MEYTMRRKASREKRNFAREILRILGMDRGSMRSSGIQEESTGATIPVDYNNWKSIHNALLEVERKKARALMDVQKRRFIY